ncbi:MAG TPA: hypothetical protein VIY47_06245 [Ignavibacteriaceae bacterium]
MSCCGTIRLMNERGEIIHFKEYKSKTERQIIIDGWKTFYNHVEKTLCIEIEPYIPQEKLDKIILAPPTVGNPTTYNNIPIYDYSKSKNGHGH